MSYVDQSTDWSGNCIITNQNQMIYNLTDKVLDPMIQDDGYLHQHFACLVIYKEKMVQKAIQPSYSRI